jgi:predicted acylesterase/phospholipase RssA
MPDHTSPSSSTRVNPSARFRELLLPKWQLPSRWWLASILIMVLLMIVGDRLPVQFTYFLCSFLFLMSVVNPSLSTLICGGSVLLCLAHLWFVGPRTSIWSDLAVYALAATAAFFVARGSKIRWAAAFLPLAWLSLSIVDTVVSTPAPLDTRRFASMRKTARLPNLRVAVALSGGGYRAALMHAGTLSALEDLGIVPTHLSTISGGSIIGAYYSLGGDPASFLTAVVKGSFNLKRELLDVQNAVRLPFPGFDRNDVQAKILDRVLLRGKRLGETKLDEAPQLVIGSTDIITGAIAGFAREGLITYSTAPNINGSSSQCFGVRAPNLFDGYQSRRLSTIVAASGAFPGAFGPVDLHLPLEGNRTDNLHLRLVDGGLTDNTGLMLLHLVAGPSSPIESERYTRCLDSAAVSRADLFIASDASAIREQPDESIGPPSDIELMIDTVYARVSPDLRALGARSPLMLSPQGLLKRRPTQGRPVRESIDPKINCMLAVAIEIAPERDLLALTNGIINADVVKRAKFRLDNEVGAKLREYLKWQCTDLVRIGAAPTDNMFVKYPIAPTEAQKQGYAARNAQERLQRMLFEQLERRIESFRRSSTLDDRFSAVHACSLYGLGRLLLLVRVPELEGAVREWRSAEYAEKVSGMPAECNPQPDSAK